ncbi:hypothetical protein ACFC06_26760 [Nocardia sp. NPDC056064]|uniref:hypothetical protein n=1 Tax=Nocardia sp. NPDC056064 TaxID=3345701 RepID=UPI0035D88E23
MVQGSVEVPTEHGGDDHRTADEYAATRLALLADRYVEPPALCAGTVGAQSVSLDELVGAGALTVHESPPTVAAGTGGVEMLSAKDIRVGRRASKNGDASVPGAVTSEPGDVLVALVGGPAVVRVSTESVLCGPGVLVLRGKPAVIDPYLLAGVLRAAADIADGKVHDLYSVRFPRVPINEQRRRGAAVAELLEFDATWRRQRVAVEQLVRTGLAGLATGRLDVSPAVIDGTARPRARLG